MVDARKLIGDGLTEFIDATKDLSAAKEFGAVFSGVSSDVASYFSETDRCLLAMPSVLVRPGVHPNCILLVLDDRVMVAWKQGGFRKKTQVEVIGKKDISAIDKSFGRTSRTARSQLLVITHSGGEIAVYLPAKTASKVAEVVQGAIDA